MKPSMKPCWSIAAMALCLAPVLHAQVENSPLVVLDSGRKVGHNQRIVTTGVRSPMQASNHALIVTVSAYARSPLRGVLKDRVAADQLAQRFGVPRENIAHLAEHEVTRDKLTAAIAALVQRVLPGDRVYVFYSGHGARHYDAQRQQCSESLVMQDMATLGQAEFTRLLKPIGAKAGKLVVMIDACHSAGVAHSLGSRDLRALLDAPQAKFSAEATPEQCRTPINFRSFAQARGIELDTTEMNFAVLAASRENEVAWDTAEGGAMMTSFMRCVDGQARDLDGSGALSMSELAACTQAQLDEGQDRSIRQHVVVTGNVDLVPGFSVKPPAPSPSPAPSPAPAPAPAPPPPPGPLPTPVVVVDTLAALQGIHAQRDDRWAVQVSVPRTQLKIGADALDFSVHSQREGHIYIFYKGTRADSFYLLFPNQLDQQNSIRAGETLRLPRAHWSVHPLGPPGRDHLLVLVTETPRDFSGYALPKEYVSAAGPFSKITPTPQSLSGLGQLAMLSGAINQPECQSKAMGERDLGVARRCSNTFGSALFSVEETP